MTNFVRRSDLAWKKLGEHVLIIDSRTSQAVHRLNEVGAFVWELCDGKNTSNSLVEKVVQEFDIDSQSASKDVEDFLKELSGLGLLEALKP